MRPALAGQVVLVTGAARGIGAELARRLAADGARLALVGLEPARLAALATSLGDAHAWVEADVTDDASLGAAVQAMVAHFGRLDVVVANAGLGSNGTVATMPMAALARVIDVNVTGVVRTVHATLPAVRASRGYYLLISSAAAFSPMPGLATYCATKAAVEQFGNALRIELRASGVRVGTAHPIWIDTDLVREQQHDLPTFTSAIRALPWPFSRIVGVETCAGALLRAITRRARRVYVPGALAPFSLVRALLASPLGDRIVAGRTRAHVEALDRLSR